MTTLFFPVAEDMAALDCPNCDCQQYATDTFDHGLMLRLNCLDCGSPVALAPVFDSRNTDLIAIRLLPALKAGHRVNRRW